MLLFRRQRSSGKVLNAVHSVMPPKQPQRQHRHRHREHPDQFNRVLQLTTTGCGVIAESFTDIALLCSDEYLSFGSFGTSNRIVHSSNLYSLFLNACVEIKKAVSG